jgi:uncharacterized protein involved in type VI secretion and phage assembly
MGTSLLDVLGSPQESQSGRMFGVAVGIVSNNQDPQNLGRIRVKFPWLSDDHESWWARIATPMAGSNRGIYFLPEVNDEVLVAFEHGDVRFPYIVGALWNGQDKSPANNSDGKNNIRVVHSRSGHLIRLDDTDGNEKIEIIDKTGNNSLTFESSSNNITMTCNGKLKLQANQGIEIVSQMDVKVQAQTTMDLEATGEANLKGMVVNIN